MSVALELASQGMLAEAKEIVTQEVDSPQWRNRVAQVLTLLDQPTDLQKVSVQERVEHRNQTDAGTALSALILASISEAGTGFESFLPFDRVRKAAERGDAVDLRSSISALWMADYDEATFSEWLSQMTRPHALNVIRVLAPVIAFGQDNAEAENTIRIIRNVGMWWP